MNLKEIILKMGEEPAKEEQSFDKFSKSKYIPIGYLQDKLDHLFTPFGWSWEILEMKAYANEMTARGRLTIKFPEITKVIDGVGATMIQTKRGEAPTLENKIQNTLRKDFPSASAFAFRNACKSLGKWFGRDLNRDNAPEYAATFIKGVQDVRKEIKGLPNLEALNEYKENNTEWIDKGWFVSAITKQEEAFKALPNPGEQLKIGK